MQVKDNPIDQERGKRVCCFIFVGRSIVNTYVAFKNQWNITMEPRRHGKIIPLHV